MDELVVCEGCRRHVKAHDTRCPFCSSTSTARAGIAIAGAVALGLSAAACGSSIAPAYSPAPYDGSVQDSSPQGDAVADVFGDVGADADGGLLGAYGPPPPQDGGAD